jgi:hypothetical protein
MSCQIEQVWCDVVSAGLSGGVSGVDSMLIKWIDDKTAGDSSTNYREWYPPPA